MELRDFIHLGGESPALQFLVIGGWAVAAHGHSRVTFDVDFLVRKADREQWRERVLGLGLTVAFESKTFLQFEQKAGDGFDLMFAEDSTFEPMWKASDVNEFNGVNARIPCVDHLLALKLHSLRQNNARRTSKDADDVEMLLRRNRIDLGNSHYAALFQKYGNKEIYETFVRILRH